MDWFELLMGFREGPHAETQARLSVVDGRLQGGERSFAVGSLTLPSLAELRADTSDMRRTGRLKLSIAEGDVRSMHLLPINRGALVQVASQFNMLEMIGPSVTPEDGVTRYEHDRTQGPACAMAAGAATIWRNYLVPCGGGIGQTAARQLDGLAELGVELAKRIGCTVPPWTMRNGYALATAEQLAAIAAILHKADDPTLDALRALLRVGLHEDVEVTDGAGRNQLVSQVFCSALPVAYSRLLPSAWAPFARLVLEAAYEATLLAGVRNVARGASHRVLLTRLGGGAFGNNEAWIDDAMARALRIVGTYDLNVVVISYGAASTGLEAVRPSFGLGRLSDQRRSTSIRLQRRRMPQSRAGSRCIARSLGLMPTGRGGLRRSWKAIAHPGFKKVADAFKR